jgi:hypothetical protein
MTRRGGPDISYRSFGEAPAPVGPSLDGTATVQATSPNLASGSLLSNVLASPPAPSLLTSSILNANLPNTSANKEHFVPHPITSAIRAESATMTTAKVTTRRQKEHDRLAWMEGVKVLRAPEEIDEPETEPVGQSERPDSVVAPTQPQTRASSVVRGGADTDTATAREGEDTERAESIMSRESLQTGTAVGKNAEYATLGEEVTSVVRRFPRVNFEKVGVLPSSGLSAELTLLPFPLHADPRRRPIVYRLPLQPTLYPRDFQLPAIISGHCTSYHRARAQRRPHPKTARQYLARRATTHGAQS